MKTTAILLLLSAFFFACDDKSATEKSSGQANAPSQPTSFTLTTKAEYLALDSTTKSLIDQTNAAVRGLQGLSEFNHDEYKDYCALFTLSSSSKISKSFLGGSIIIMSLDDQAETEPWKGAADTSIRLNRSGPVVMEMARIPRYMADKKLTKIDVVVRSVDSCVLLSY